MFFGVLHLSKEVLWISIGQKTAKLEAIKVRGLKKKSATWTTTHCMCAARIESQTMESSSKFERLQLCSPLTYRDSKYLFGKI